MFKFETGQIVKDVVTNFKGVVMARVNYLTGCNQYGISQQELTKEGKKPEWEYFDENRLILIDPNGIVLQSEKDSSKGADGNFPIKN